MRRRYFLRLSVFFAVAAMIITLMGCNSKHRETVRDKKYRETVRDRLWIWAHPAGSYDGQWGLPANSSTTPLQGAAYLGIKNIIMVRYWGQPEMPFDSYAQQFADTEKLMWSFVGGGGQSSQEEREHVFELAGKMTNITGLFMDDFFHGNAGPGGNSAEPPAAISIAELRNIREKLTLPDRKLDLAVTLYDYQLNPAICRHLELCDLVSLWTWEAGDLAKLEENFVKYRTFAPDKRTLLGIYMWDFGLNRPLPMELMRMQCETALRWLRDGKIEGMIFLASNICDMDIEAVQWAKEWIAEHGDENI